MSCNICVEAFNKSSRKKITCDFCSYSACTACTRTYILSSTDLPHCMNCKKEWSRKVLVNKFSKSFINKEIKIHKEKIFFEREKALLPATQPIVERQLRKEEIKKTINELRYKIRALNRELYSLDGRSLDEEKKQFVRACPSNSCRGFLSTQWKCGLCNIYTCSECHSLKGPNRDSEHTCVPEDIETAKLLAKDTKTCPKCACLIHKIDGCDQMWCVQCHTAFNWKTGRIESGVIHNPEYFRWMQLRNHHLERNPLDVQCGRELDRNMVEALTDMLPLDSNFIRFIRGVIHIREVVIPGYQGDPLAINESLRVKYLRNEIPEDKFKRNLQRVSKAMEKRKEISGVYGMFVSCATDIAYRWYEDLVNKKDTTGNDDELSELVTVTNSFLKEIATVYGSSVYLIVPYNELKSNPGIFIRSSK